MIILFSSCEEEITNAPLPTERTFQVMCYGTERATLVLSFPLMDETPTNPIEISNMVSPSRIEIEVVSTSPLVIKALAKKKNITFYLELYENNTLLLRDSIHNDIDFQTIWLTYEFD